MFPTNRETNTLIFFSIFSVALLVARVMHMNALTYIFLTWNLFLAAIPYVLVKFLSKNESKASHQFYNVFVLLAWLLFFPNAPYIFTDLFHLKYTSSTIIWYDTTLILSFAWTGMLFGFLSLLRIERQLRKTMHIAWSKLIIYAMLFVSAFGVYIGRYLRFNSWDIVSDPFALFYEIAHRLVSPFSHPRTWGMTLVFGLFLSLIYSSFHLIRERR